MKEILNFVQVYWREILEVVTLLSTFLVFLCKKVKVENPSIIAFIDRVLPGLLINAEHIFGDGHGDEKKAAVIEALLNHLKKNFSGIDEEQYKKVISEKIEFILSTPQKKG